MALESFYGGKPGISPVIRNSFKYINDQDPAFQAKIGTTTPYNDLSNKEAALLNIDNTTTSGEITWTADNLKYFTMDSCFSDPNYHDVWYSELCIIDTENKMNPNNGKIFRRTLKRVNTVLNAGDTTYAEYIGQIVGPSGGVPNIRFGSIDSMKRQAAGLEKTLDTDEGTPLDVSHWDYAYPTIDENNITFITQDNVSLYTPDNRLDDTDPIATLESDENNNIVTVPGKQIITEGTDTTVKWNDKIRYTWCNVRRTLTNGGQDDAWIYLGFEIPYTFFETKAINIPYYANRDTIGYSEDETLGHNFYHNLTFYIPRGARGIGPEELFIVGKDNKEKPEELYNFDAILHDDETDVYSIDPTAQLITPSESTYWVAKWRLYNPKTTDIVEVYQYIGAYKDIDNIVLHHGQTDYNNDGTVEVHYSDGTSVNFSEALTWITDVNVDTNKKIEDENTGNLIDNPNYGKFVITFNNNKIANGKYTATLPLIKSVTYTDNNGKIVFTYSGSENPIEIEADGIIQYDKKIQIDDNSDSNDYGKVTITKNTSESRTEAVLPLIKSTSYNKNTGIITFTYSKIGDVPIGKLEYITQMRITNDDGTIQYRYNTESTDDTAWKDITDENGNPLQIRDIEDLQISNGLTPSSVQNPQYGHLYILYRGETAYEDLGQVKVSPTVGIVLQTTTDDVEHWLDGLNGTNNESLENVVLNSDTIIYHATGAGNNPTDTDGNITVNGVDKTGGFIALVDNTDSENPITHIIYYDPISQKWIDGGTLGGSSSISNDGAAGIFIQTNDGLTPNENLHEKGTFTFLQTNSGNANNSLLKMPWNISLNYGYNAS